MPDACPAGPLGTIPVGGMVSSAAIHPGMHSADICSSMAISIVDDLTTAALLAAVHKLTRFGPGGRQFPFGGVVDLLDATNPLLRDAKLRCPSNLDTQPHENHSSLLDPTNSH